MRFLYVLTRRDEVGEADPEWMRSAYKAVACPECKAVIPRHEAPVDVDLLQEPQAPLAPVGFPISVSVLRTDLFASLHMHMSEYYFGSVQVKGRRLSRYMSVFAGDAVRLKQYADKQCEYAPCPTCGRNFQHLVVGNMWFKRADIGGRLVFSDVGGGSLYAAQSLIDGLGAELRRELKLSPIDVRD